MEIGNFLLVGREAFMDSECPLRITIVNGILCSKKHCSSRGYDPALRTCDVSAVILRQQRIKIGVIPIYASLELVFVKHVFPPRLEFLVGALFALHRILYQIFDGLCVAKSCVTIVGCPKLDPVDYSKKLTEIIRENDIKSVTIVRMEVPCCGGLELAAKKALQASGKFIPWQVVTISLDGHIIDS